jgi:hypothetical protein
LELSKALKGLPIGHQIVENALIIRNYIFRKNGAELRNTNDRLLDGIGVVLSKGCPIWIKGSEFIGILEHYIRYFDKKKNREKIKHRCPVCF